MKKLNFFLIVMLMAFSFQINAQSFASGMDGFSRKKPAKITLTDGSEVEGPIKKLKRKKGNFVSITIETAEGKTTYASENIKHMYLAPSGLQKLASAIDKVTDAQQWDKSDLNPALIKDGYAYFETTVFKKKKKTFTGMLQLVNVTSAGSIRVYFDPYAKEGASASVGGITVAGGLDKSYYIKQGDNPAVFTKKSEYRKNGVSFYEGCQEAIDAYSNSDLKWKNFAKHVQTYYDSCDK